MKGGTHIDGVRTLFDNVGDGTHSSRGHHNLVISNDGVFVDFSKDVSSGNVISDFEIDGIEIPLEFSIESGSVDSSRDVDGARELGDGLERSLNSVVDISHESLVCRRLSVFAPRQRMKYDGVPGPSSTERGLPVRRTGSPIVIPEVSS